MTFPHTPNRPSKKNIFFDDDYADGTAADGKSLDIDDTGVRHLSGRSACSAGHAEQKSGRSTESLEAKR